MITALQRQLAIAVQSNVYQDFALRHLSGNLMTTMRIEYGEDDAKVVIPAVRYDLKEWKRTKAIIYTPEKGSYANAVDIYGGFSKTHQNYADRAVFGALRSVLAIDGLEYDIEER